MKIRVAEKKSFLSFFRFRCQNMRPRLRDGSYDAQTSFQHAFLRALGFEPVPTWNRHLDVLLCPPKFYLKSVFFRHTSRLSMFIRAPRFTFVSWFFFKNSYKIRLRTPATDKISVASQIDLLVICRIEAVRNKQSFGKKDSYRFHSSPIKKSSLLQLIRTKLFSPLS